MHKILPIIILILGGCATDPKGLIKKAETQTVEIKTTLQNDETLGLANVKWHKELKAGIYTSIGEDAKGIYFEGPKGCVVEQAEVEKPIYYNGGFWVPKNPKLKPKIYRYLGSNMDEKTAKDAAVKVGYGGARAANPAPYTAAGAVGGAVAGALTSSLIKSELGKIGFLPEIHDDAFFSEILKSVKTSK